MTDLAVYLATPSPAWMAHAACRGMGPSLFYPEQGQDTITPRRVCKTCPVRVDCLNYAIVEHENLGTWGGVSQRERQRMITATRVRAS